MKKILIFLFLVPIIAFGANKAVTFDTAVESGDVYKVVVPKVDKGFNLDSIVLNKYQFDNLGTSTYPSYSKAKGWYLGYYTDLVKASDGWTAKLFLSEKQSSWDDTSGFTKPASTYVKSTNLSNIKVNDVFAFYNDTHYPRAFYVTAVNATLGYITVKEIISSEYKTHALDFSTEANTSKSPFRYGMFITGQWIGEYFTMTNANAYKSVLGNVDLTINSINLGSNNYTGGYISSAFGADNLVYGSYSSAIGKSNRVNGYTSFVAGQNNYVLGEKSYAFGIDNVIRARFGTTFGISNQINTNNYIDPDNNIYDSFFLVGSYNDYTLSNKTYNGFGILLGKGLKATTPNKIVLGSYNANKTNAILEVGNGTSSSDRANAMTVYDDGTIESEKGLIATQPWVKSLVQDFRVVVDMTPSPIDDPSKNLSVSTGYGITPRYHFINNVNLSSVYSHTVTGASTTLTKEDTSATFTQPTITSTASGTTITNGTNVVHSSSLPDTYDKSKFTVSNITVNQPTIKSTATGGGVTYSNATGATTTLTEGVKRLTNSTGTVDISSVNHHDYMLSLPYWTDIELKVIDKYGNIVYYTATYSMANPAVGSMHAAVTDGALTSSGTYKNPGDKLEVWYWSNKPQPTTNTNSWVYNTCYGSKCDYTRKTNTSIYTDVGDSYAVTKIWIKPSFDSTYSKNVPIYTGPGVSTTKNVVWGQYVRQVFENPENTIVVWRQRNIAQELYNKAKLWRPVYIEHYGRVKTYTPINYGGQTTWSD